MYQGFHSIGMKLTICIARMHLCTKLTALRKVITGKNVTQYRLSWWQSRYKGNSSKPRNCCEHMRFLLLSFPSHCHICASVMLYDVHTYVRLYVRIRGLRKLLTAYAISLLNEFLLFFSYRFIVKAVQGLLGWAMRARLKEIIKSF